MVAAAVASVTPGIAHPSAVTWINGRRALVAQISRDGRISSRELNRNLQSEAAFVASVVSTIGDQDRVLILGPGSIRLALEREYVSIYHRPERLVDVEPEGSLSPEALAERLRNLAA
jgi:hypothetical protein